MTGAISAHFVASVVKRFPNLGVSVGAVLTDYGPEYVARSFTAAVAALGLDHLRIPARSPNHNAVCERFQDTALQECWPPTFHRRRFAASASSRSRPIPWLIHYNTRRRNHSDFMRGRSPRQVLDSHRCRKPA